MTDLSIVLPGGGYTALGPAIRFPVMAAEEAGYLPVNIEYPMEALAARDLAAVVGEARRQVTDALGSTGGDRVTVIAKSLGTRVVLQIADLFDGVDDLSVVWLTPLFGDAQVRDGAIASGWRSLIVAGDQDPFHDEAGVATVAAAMDATVVMVPGADHALEVPGDVDATIDRLKRVVSVVGPWLGGGT